MNLALLRMAKQNEGKMNGAKEMNFKVSALKNCQFHEGCYGRMDISFMRTKKSQKSMPIIKR